MTVQREPSNVHDPLALAVYLGSGERDSQRLGYVAGWLAAALAPLLDEGGMAIDGKHANNLPVLVCFLGCFLRGCLWSQDGSRAGRRTGSRSIFRSFLRFSI